MVKRAHGGEGKGGWKGGREAFHQEELLELRGRPGTFHWSGL